MTKLIRKELNVIDPDWKPSTWDKLSLLSIADYVRNKEVTKLFKERKILRWQIDGGYIWMEIN